MKDQNTKGGAGGNGEIENIDSYDLIKDKQVISESQFIPKEIKKKWFAFGNSEPKGIPAEGSTPEEAVANLYLVLNKK